MTDLLKVTLGAAAAAILGACSALTVAPRPVTAFQPSLDGNTADSGVLGQLPDGGWALTSGAVARYEGLITDGYGKPFIPPVVHGSGYRPLAQGLYTLKEADGKSYLETLPTGDYEMDGQHVALFAQMILATRQPPKP